MATHDYVIDNSTGANVRSDLNNVLQAILTNNSSSSAPSTTAAYMWWADTTTGILKIRNSANDGWVELLQLDGTLTLEDGSASTPGLAFRDDLNTGIFSSAADTFNVATGGFERMELGATTIFNDSGADVDFRIEGDSVANLFFLNAGTDRIGINEDAPSALFHVAGTDGQTVGSISSSFPLLVSKNGNCGIAIIGASNSKSIIALGDPDDADVGEIEYNHADNTLVFSTGATEVFRADASQRFMVNMSTSVTGGKFQVNNTFNTFFAASNDAQGCVLQLEKTRSTSPGSYTIVQDGDVLGDLQFKGSNGSASVIGARIFAKVNGTPGSGNDLPTDLIFRIMPDGSGSTQEAMRIRSDRTVEIATEGAIAGFSSSHINSGAPLKIYKSSGSTHAGLQLIWDHFNTNAGIKQKIQFTIGDDASSDGFNNAGYIAIEKADSWQSGAGRSSAMVFATTSAATESEAMRIRSDGNVGIDNSNPPQKLTIGDGDLKFFHPDAGTAHRTTFIEFGNSSNRITSESNFGSEGSSGYSAGYKFTTKNFNGSAFEEIMALGIQARGHTLFGQSSADTAATGARIAAISQNQAASYIYRGDAGIVMIFGGGGGSGQFLLEFRHGGTGIGSVTKNGTSNVSFNTSSDYRLKENIVDLTGAITRIKTLQPKRFNWISDETNTLQDGFLAHEVTAVPEAITGKKDAVVTQEMLDSKEAEEHSVGDPIYQQIDQSKLVPLLTAAVQEAIAKIEVLETKVAALEAA